MSQHNNPQHEQMADDNMVRCLAAQAAVIWPLEAPSFGLYPLADDDLIVDVGCGTGEISERLLRRFPRARLLGVDLIGHHLEVARARCAWAGDRVRFVEGDAFALGTLVENPDLVVCRHLVQAVPRAQQLVAELVRVMKPGGWLHLLAEDYGMIHFAPAGAGASLGRSQPPEAPDLDRFWLTGPAAFARSVETDLWVGRKAYGWLVAEGLEQIRVDTVRLDPTTADRALFRQIWETWRDGFSGPIVSASPMTEAEVAAAWAAMIAIIDDPAGYFSWTIPLLSARKPG